MSKIADRPAATVNTAPGKALILVPDIAAEHDGCEGPRRDAEARRDEAAGLAEAIGLVIARTDILRMKRAVPATLIGKGAVDRLAEALASHPVDLVVVDHALSPVQQRNLEKALQSKVIDRTGLILEIFGARAQTREGRLQVELASLQYQRSRLVRSWTHLERQRGGYGFLGGPGESQLEIDRRLITDRIARIRRELDSVKRTRGLHRRARKKVPYPVVALVGYTNAGKSTLFNRLSGAGVMAEDLLFATLDPTLRQVTLESGRKVILSDTVGFISDLPTQLVAAFRATLEEVLDADLILHVRDIAHPDSEAQRADVLAVLEEMEIDAGSHAIIEVLNKVDLLEPSHREALLARYAGGQRIAVSAVSGAGLPALLEAVEQALAAGQRQMHEVSLDPGAGDAIAWLYRRGDVQAREDGDCCTKLTVGLDGADYDRFCKRFAEALRADG